MSQAEKSTDKGFLTTVLDAITFIPRKIWGLIQMLFCCNSVSLTAQGLLDDPEGFMKELEKHPEKDQEFATNLLSDMPGLLKLIETCEDPKKKAAWLAKISDPQLKVGVHIMAQKIISEIPRT
jgi:hypothetical protein